jgi:hypothetical protein
VIRLGDRRVRFIKTGWDASYGPAAGETELFESSDRSDRYGPSWRKAAVQVCVLEFASSRWLDLAQTSH